MRLYHVELLWNARGDMKTHALVWATWRTPTASRKPSGLSSRPAAPAAWGCALHGVAEVSASATPVPCVLTRLCAAASWQGATCVEILVAGSPIQPDGTYQECRAEHGGGASLMVTVSHVTVPARLKLNNLRDALRARGMPTGGSKEALAARLAELLDLTPLPGAR